MPEAAAVRGMFARIAGRYDRANRWLSGGIDRGWRRTLRRAVAAEQPRTVVDLATGSGDVALALAARLPPQPDVSILGLDFCAPMLAEADRKRAALAPAVAQRVRFALGDALDLPLADGSTDVVTLAFGLRNFADRARGLAEIRRVLRPGGTLLVLEFSQPDPWLRPAYFFYLRHVLPRLASWLTGDRSAYEYLGDTIGRFPSRPELIEELQRAGFVRVEARGLTGGIVALHTARR